MHRFALITATVFLFGVFFFSIEPAFAQSSNPVCSAEIAITNPKQTLQVSTLMTVNIFSTVSNPSSCRPATISLSAIYYDANEDVICSGVVSGLVDQNASVANTNLEIRPGNPMEFVRVVSPLRPPFKRLVCNNLEGNIEIPQSEVVKAASVRLRATILPQYGGVHTSEARVALYR